MKHATAVALALLGAPSWTSAQAPAPSAASATPEAVGGVIFAPRLKAGDSFTYDIVRTLRIEQSEPGATSPPTAIESSLSMTVRFDVGVVRADGTTQVGCEFQRLEVQLATGSETKSFAHPAEAAEDAPKGALAAVGVYLVERRPRLVIDREGRLGSLEGLDDLPDVAAKAMKQDRSVSPEQMSILGVDRVRDALRPIFQPAAPELPSRLFRDGDTWVVRRHVPLAELGSVSIAQAWTVGGAGDVFRARAEVSGSAEPPRGIVSAAPAFTLKSTSGTGQFAWDPVAGRLESRQETLMLGTRYALGPIEIDQVEASTLEITRAGSPGR